MALCMGPQRPRSYGHASMYVYDASKAKECGLRQGRHELKGVALVCRDSYVLLI